MPSSFATSSSPPRRASALAGALALFAFALPAGAQNLLVNGRFDDGITGWTVRPEGAAAPSPVDIGNSPASGSALLTTNEALAAARVYPLDQCIALTATGRYRIGASGRVVAGPSAAALVWSYFYRASATCSGGSNAAGGRFIETPTWSGVEQVVEVTTLPATIQVLLGIEKAPAGGAASGHFDDVFVLLDDVTFIDGFEGP